ncbi:MAG: hypothetical protein ACK53Y_11645, partial [bacterium]
QHSLQHKSSLEDTDLTVVSYACKARATTLVLTTKTKQNDTTTMNAVASWCFKDFQKAIIPFVQKIIDMEEQQDHPFIQ